MLSSLGKKILTRQNLLIAVAVAIIIVVLIFICFSFKQSKDGFMNYDDIEPVGVSEKVIRSLNEISDIIYNPAELKVFDFDAVRAQDQACRIIRNPSSIPAKEDGAEVGCGWYYIQSQKTPSFSALGSRSGPLNPELLAKAVGGKWYFHKDEMEKVQILEDKKKCVKIKKCDLADLYPTKCAWCSEISSGIPKVYKGDATCLASDPAYKCYNSQSTSSNFDGMVTKSRQIGTVDFTNADYTIAFDITLKGISGGWTNIFRVGTGTGDCCAPGQRNPGIWIWPGQTQLHVRVGDNNDGNWGVDVPGLQVNRKSSFKLQTMGNQVTVTVDGKATQITQPSARAKGNGLKVWMSDPWYEPVNGLVENLSFIADGKTIFGGPKLINNVAQCGAQNNVCNSGSFPRQCLVYLANAAGMKESGMIMKILRHPGKFLTAGTSQHDSLLKILKTLQENEGLPYNLTYFSGGGGERSDYIHFYTEVDALLTFGKTKEGRDAAAWLASGGDYDFEKCDSSVSGPYELEFLQNIFLKNGGQAAGALFPQEADLVNYNTKTCDKIKEIFTKACREDIVSGNSATQLDAINKCIAAKKEILDVRKIPGLQIWLDGKDPLNNGSAPAEGVSMPTWKDKSGNQNDMIAQKPANYSAGTNSLNFNRSLYNSKNVSTYPIDVFVVVKLNNTSGPFDICGLAQKANDNFNSLTFGEYRSGLWHNGSSYFSRTSNAVAASRESSSNFLLMEWSLANNNFYINRNGVQIMETKSYTWDKGTPYFQLGSRLYVDAGNNMVGNIAEVIVFNSQLATSTRQKVEGYLAWKWGLESSLPSGHPYQNSAPN